MGGFVSRGKIIFYNATEGRGVASHGSGQVTFEISQWGGSDAPRLNQVVDVIEESTGTVRLIPVDESAVFAEKAGESLKSLRDAASPLARSVVAQIGSGGLIAYLVFVLAAFYWTFVLGIFGIELTLSHLLSSDGQWLLLWLSVATVGVPFFWADRRAWLSWMLPLAVTILLGLVPIFYDNTFSGLAALAHTASPFRAVGGHIVAGVGTVLLALGFGAYAAIASGAYLAWVGLIRFQQGIVIAGPVPSSVAPHPEISAATMGTGTSISLDDRARTAKSLTQILYGLYALSWFFGVTALIAIIIDYVKKDDVVGTPFESHFRWQIRTFWFGLLYATIGAATSMILIGIPILIGAGVPAGRVVSYGRGEMQPIASNATDAGRARNRRVEILVRPRN